MKKFLGIVAVVSISLMLIGSCMVQPWSIRWGMQTQVETMTESAKELQNPNRGFYHIYGVLLSDEPEDVKKNLQEKMKSDTKTTLALMEINLYKYRDGDISQEGMDQLKQLFTAMSESEKQWVVRFLYDWGEKNADFEPEKISIILRHMKQVAPVLKNHADDLFVVQGLFTGIYGEMNQSGYGDPVSMQKLARQLAASTDETTYLSVRTPVQWRTITKTADASDQTSVLTKRMGLFNDGMLGNSLDLGTYGEQSKKQAGSYKAWTRDEELKFQNTLCAHVPNGGEVVLDNPYNDLENAVKSMKTMHITYINRDHDTEVMDKWASSTVHTNDCFDGMDGLSYMERHLGYRLVLLNPKMTYNLWKDTLHMELSLKNVGFAPVYKACDGIWTVKNEDGEVIYRQKMTEKVTGLTGENQEKKLLTITKNISLKGKNGKKFYIYFALKDHAENKMITFGNEQEKTKDGYLIGTLASKTESSVD